MLEVAVLDPLHESFAVEKIGMEIGGELAGHDEKLVVDDFGKRNGAAGGSATYLRGGGRSGEEKVLAGPPDQVGC